MILYEFVYEDKLNLEPDALFKKIADIVENESDLQNWRLYHHTIDKIEVFDSHRWIHVTVHEV